MTDGIVLRNKVLKGQMYTLEQMGDNYLIANKSQKKTLKITPVLATAELIFKEAGKLPDETDLKGGDKNMGGYDKAKKVAEELKEEQAEKEEKALAQKEEVKNQLAVLSSNPELQALYKANAKVGSENLNGAAAPYLRIHTATSTANELADGTYPKDGNFFYNPTKEEYNEIFCHILTISKGFKVWQEDKKTGVRKQQFNQIVGGLIIDDTEYKPFLWYLNGMKLSPMWEFGKEASFFTNSGIPMFALTIKITTKQEKSDYGMKWIPVFEIVKENEEPVLVLDTETFNNLKKETEQLQENIAKLIDAKASEEVAEVVTPLQTDPVDEYIPQDVA